MFARSGFSIGRTQRKRSQIPAFGKKEKNDGRGAWWNLIRIAQLFSEENYRITRVIMSRALHVLMLDKRIKHFGKCVRVQGRAREIRTGIELHCATVRFTV